ncbi:MAG: DUF11 domain-containing protein [Candidatus Aminicenantes bacterium]|nr:DUF11 domain-containing protein [Candidatus Aminicenantes bacterium]
MRAKTKNEVKARVKIKTGAVKKAAAAVEILFLISIILCINGLFLQSQSIGISGDSTINKCETKSYTIDLLNNSGNPLTDLVITVKLENFTGFSYVGGTALIDDDDGGTPTSPLCTADPAISGGYTGGCAAVPAAPYLTWDMDSCLGSAYTLADGRTLSITFSLETDCNAVSGSLDTLIDYEIGGTPDCDDTGVHSIQVLPGGVTIKKTANVIPQEVGQDVTWTLTVENTGFGIIENLVITDVLGAGLVYVSSTPAGVNAGQTTTWGSAEIAALASMNPGDTVNIDISATVFACENLENTADVRWGCDLVTDCFNTAVDGGTATASVLRIPRSPLLEYTPPDIDFTYCSDTENISFTITNLGDGTADDVYIIVDFGSLTVSNVSGGAIYNSVDKRFELAVPLAAGGDSGDSYNLSFDLRYSTWCGASFPSGSLVWQTRYKDECDNDFYPPIKISTINAPAGSTSLSLTKTGGSEAIQIDEQVTYTITSAYSGPLSCGSPSGSPGLITVVDTIPAGFTVVNAGSGTYDASALPTGDGASGGTVTWTYTPPATLNTNIIIQAPDRSQCDTACFTYFTNSVTAGGADCCGCAMNASASQTGAIECEEVVNSNKTAAPATAERCNNVQYTNTYDFLAGATMTLDTLVFDEHAENQQAYVGGSLSVFYDGGDITACVAVTDTTPGGSLQLDFSGCAVDVVANKNLTITYSLTITPATVSACAGGTFYSWSSLDLGITGSECLQDGVIQETTVVTVQPPGMSLSIGGLGTIVDKCQTHTITLTLSQTSTLADPRDVRLVLSGLNYYIVDTTATVCSGAVAPSACIPAVVGNDYVWYFGDGFTGSGQTAAIQVDVRKRCGSGGELTGTAYFDDNCTDDATYDDTCSTAASASPGILRSGDLLIEKSPEVYYADNNTVVWKIYLTNRGSGSAFYAWLDDLLGSGLDYVGALVGNMTGVTITADQDHNGGAVNGCTITIDEMAPGERREVTFTAQVISCANLTNTATSSWGCAGSDCQAPVTDTATVEIPAPLLVNTNTVVTPVDACASPRGFITLRNAGQTTCYNLQISEALPPGLTYVPGTTRWQVNGTGWNGPAPVYDPNPTASPLIWTTSEIPGLAVSDPGDTIDIEFDMTALCPFVGGNVTLSTSYDNPCGQVFTNADSVFTVAFREPTILVTKTRSGDPIDCGALVSWTITVQNSSGYTLPVIWVEDVLGGAYTYQSSLGSPPFTSDNGTNVGQVVAWELRNVNHNDTVTLTLTAAADNPPCSANLDNTVTAYWGCGAADGSSSTKPGVDPPDNTLCLGVTGTGDTDTPTREPTVGFFNIALNPASIDSCSDSAQLTVTIQNTGPTAAENLDLVITLPTGISYNGGSSNIDCGAGSAPAADPAIAGSQLIYRDITDNADGKANNLCDTLAAGNTMTLVFSITSSCFVTAQMDFDLYYYDCCEDTQYSTSDSQAITAQFPNLSITKTPLNAQVDCSANQTWNITVTNSGTGNAQVVRIEDTLGDWIDYVSSDTSPASGTPATAMGGQVYGWEITNLAGSTSRSFTITGQLNPDAPQSDCTALLRQNNVRAIWGCGVAGDAVDNDPTSIIYDCTDGTWANAAAAQLQMPDLVVTAINPTIACTADGSVPGSLTVSVQNQGDGNTVNNFTVQITDGLGWTGTGTYSANIAAGGTATVTIDTTGWAPDCQPCATPYVFNVTDVDFGDAVCECNEGNNAFGPFNYITPIPDLIVSDIDFTPVGCSGDNISGSVSVIVTNNGCAAANNFPVSLTTDGCLSFVNQTVVTLAAGASTIVSFPITGSWADCTVEDCRFTADADPTDAVCECDGANNDRVETYSTTLPDLIVTDIDFSNITCAFDSIGGFVSVTVQNQGFGSAVGFQVSLDTDGCLSFANQSVLVPVGSGASTTVNFPVTPPWGNCVDCDCDFTAAVDAGNVICECDGSNNQRTETYTQALPDLRVNSVTPSATCVSDGTLTGSVMVNVENIGCGNANNAVVRLISTCGTVFVDRTVNLTSGSSANLTFNYTPDCAGCTCIFIALIDPDGLICECAGTNNVVASAAYTLSIPDITVQSDTLSISCSGSSQATVTGTVNLANPGCGLLFNATVPMRFTLYDNPGCAGNVIDQWTQNFTAATIFPGGGTQAFTITPQIVVSDLVANSTGCLVSIRVEADYSAAICECDGTNNTYCADNKAVDIPDIEVNNDTLSAACLADGQVTVSGAVTLTNNGCGSNLTNTVPMRFTLYDNTGCAGNVIDQWTQSFAAVNIAAGGGTQAFTITPRSITSDMVTNSTGCRVSIRVEADYTNAICESDGTDNSYCTDKDVDIPNIQVQSHTLDIVPLADGQVRVTGAITFVNNGCGSAVTTDLAAQFTLYDNVGGTGSIVHQWSETFNGVNITAPGGTQTFTLTDEDVIVDLCNNSTNCRVSLVIEADYTATICESDGTDNDLIYDKTITIPELTVNNIASSVTCLGDGSLTGTTVTVSNNGCGPAPGAVVRLTSDCGLTFADETVDLPAGETRDIFFAFTAGIAACVCNFTATIDPDNNIPECDGTNNVTSAAAAMLIPDIEVQAEALTIDCADDGVVRVSGTITLVNNGCGPNLTGAIPMRLSLYGDSGCSGTMLHQWTETLSGVDIPSAGGTRTFTIQPHDITLNYCTGATNCRTSLFIEADYNNSICEWDGTDNTFCADKTSACLDLEAASLTVSTRCLRDGSIEGAIEVTVTNSGGNPITRDFSVLVNDGRGWTSELRYNADLGGTLPLPAAESAVLTFTWDRNFDNSNCSFNAVTAQVDAANEICQCTTDNDSTTISHQLDFPNLKPTAVTVRCSRDNYYLVRVIVENDGCADAGEFTLHLEDSLGNGRDIPVAGLDREESITIDVPQWPANCEIQTITFTAVVDSADRVCELEAGDNTLEYLFDNLNVDVLMGDVEWTCLSGGIISFSATVVNNGSASAAGAALTVYDEDGVSVHTETFTLSAGDSRTINFTLSGYPANRDITFRFAADGGLTVCECSGENNEKTITVNCPSEDDEPRLKLDLTCPPGQQPGGLFRFELQIQNNGPTPLQDINIEGSLPDKFQYVAGSSARDGQALPDPQPGPPLTWQMGTLQPGQTTTLIYTAAADADIDPGRCCSEANSWAMEVVPGGKTIKVTSDPVQCCTVVTRQPGAGCCLRVEEQPAGFFRRPAGPISFIEPYFHTESAMFTAYAIFSLWQDAPPAKGDFSRFVKEKLQNYARSTIEELYLKSRFGLTRDDGSLWLSFGGGYPQKDQDRNKNIDTKDAQNQKTGPLRWLRKNVDVTMTVAQVGSELLALNAIVQIEKRPGIRKTLTGIIEKKLAFLEEHNSGTGLPHGWELGDKKKKSAKNNEPEKRKIRKLVEKSTLNDIVKLYLSLIELKNSGYEKAPGLIAVIEPLLEAVNNRGFDMKHLRQEFLFALALLKSGEAEQAKAKIRAFEAIYKDFIEKQQAGSSEESKDGKKGLLANLQDHALAAALVYKTGGALYPELIKKMKEKYYVKDTGIFANQQPDATFKLTLDSLTALMFSFDVKETGDREHHATVLYRSFDEVGIFLKKRSLLQGKPLYSLLKNYPYDEPLLPVLNFSKVNRDTAPVFTRDSVVHSTSVKPLGETLVPGDFFKILSPAYENRSAMVASLSFGLQYLGRILQESPRRVIKEEGRSLDETGKKYVDSLIQNRTGILLEGFTLLPFEHIAVKGPSRGEQNLEPLNAGNRFTTRTLADYMTAETYYLTGSGKNAAEVHRLLDFQARIVAKFAALGYIPAAFDLYVEKEEILVSPVPGKAAKITTAKLFHLLKDKEGFGFLEKALSAGSSGSPASLEPEDMIFLSSAPQLAPYFQAEIQELVDRKDAAVSDNCADIIGRQLLKLGKNDIEKSLANLHSFWDQDAVIPKPDRFDHIERGQIYRYSPRQLLLYLLAARFSGDFQFERTLNILTHLLENEWGVKWEDSFITLPSREYRLFKEEVRKHPEPGDLVNVKVRVDNTCPAGTGSARDIASLYLRSYFSPALVFVGTQPYDGLETMGDFQWRYEGFPEGAVLEYFYQALVPGDFQRSFINGSIYAGGRQGYRDFGLDSAAGDDCNDTHYVKGLNIVPFTELRGLVFDDRNVNGSKDAEEEGIPNILFKDTCGRMLRSDADGRFPVLAGDDHEGIQVDLSSLPGSYLSTTPVTRLVDRRYVGDIYFGLVSCRTLTGFVYVDENGNGSYDEGESRPAKIVVTAGKKETTSGENGRFIFRNLPKLWQEFAAIKKEQPFYKGPTGKFKFQLD